MHGRGAIRTVIASPRGPIHVAATERGVVAVEWLTTDEAFGAGLARRSVAPVEDAADVADDDPRRAHLGAALGALDALLGGRPPGGVVPFDLADRPAWDRRVLEAVADIAWGRTVSYGEIARRIGAPRAARAVGGALGRNPIALLIPCHRVIAADGTLGGYGGGLDRKRWLLAHEGALAPVDAALPGIAV